ncbi:MAG TPA: PEGA domain-containing protein, partial [Thermotogales bacterium]|nr:PEGA domain-containing protein [Thermotogales bacterium]
DGTVLLVNEDLKGNVELHITTFPSGVSIYLNDSYVGDTPLNMEIPSGIYDMRLVKEGYKEEKLKIDLRFDDVRYFVWFMRRR